MQNTPLLNTPQTAPQANSMNTAKSNAPAAGQPGENNLFQQQLAQRIQQKNKHLQAQTPQQPTKNPGTADTQTATESGMAPNDIISRKIKGLLGKSAADNLAQDNPATGNTAIATADGVENIVENPLAPIPQNILAQLQQAQPVGNPTGMPVSGTQAQSINAAHEPASADIDTGLATRAAERNDHGKPLQQDLNLAAKTSADQTATTSTPRIPAEHTGRNTVDMSTADMLGKTAPDKAAVAGAMPLNNSAAITQTAATHAAAQHFIQAYPGKEGWNQAIGQRVMWMIGAAQQSATLTLNPPDMGPLQIVINVHNDKADASFFSDRQEVRQALEDGMDNLREMMKESGINLGQTNINQREQAAQDSARQLQPTASPHTEQQGTETAAVASTPVRVALGLVDTFA